MTRTLFDRINRHPKIVTLAVVLIALALGFTGTIVADTNDANFDPTGELYDLAARADEVLQGTSSIEERTFLVESADGGDVLTAAALSEWLTATERVRTDTELGEPLVTDFDPELGTNSPGILSIADIVDAQLPAGLANASDSEVKAVLAELLADGSPMAGLRQGLAESATVTTATDGTAAWTAPAFLATITYDGDHFAQYTDSELWLRSVQAAVRDGAVHTDPIGVAIDFDTVFEEQILASAPFIFLAVALIVLLVAAVHRSYWSAVLVASGLGITMLAYYGIASLAGLKMGSLLLTFIVPIAMISFGVDFYIHGSGRVREMQVDEGMSGERAYPAGMRAVFTALLLAALSSVAAFLSNSISSTEAIVEFGIGAGIALLLAFLILGLVAPRMLVGLESFVGANPVKGVSRWWYRLAMLAVAIIAGLAVTLAAVQPQIGVAIVAAVIPLLVLVPAWLTRRRNRRAVARDRLVSSEIGGNAHGLSAAGTLVHGLASRPRLAVPVIFLIGTVSLVAAFQVERGFEVQDLISSRTDFTRSIERINHHFPSNGGGGGTLFVEGDLTDPANLAALGRYADNVEASGAEFGRTATGELLVSSTAADLVRTTMGAPAVVEAIEATGVSLIDGDGDGLPDTAAGIAAIYDHITRNGVVDADGNEVWAAESVPEVLALHDDGTQATAIWIGFASFTDGDVIIPAWDAMDDAATALEQSTTGLTTIGVTGGVILQYDSLEAFSRSMIVSLPLAVLLTLIVATIVLRSFRYAVASVIPIGFVVAGVYGFMAVVGFQINIVTATIAAIAVGVGIDFSTHFTARFREELETSPTRLDALRRAGNGTGGALVISALSSVLGFAVMAIAPTPIFSTYGILTAVMIALALVAALAILPTVLLAVTPKSHDAAIDAEGSELTLAA